MNRTDAYVAIATIAWLAGAYWIGEGHKARAAALDRQTTAAEWCSIEYVYAYGSSEDCKAISELHRAKNR